MIFTIATSMLCYNRNSPEVVVVAHPDIHRVAAGYEMSTLGCYSSVQKMTKPERVAFMLIEALQAIVRDNVDALAMHAALLSIEEYREICAPDMPGMNAHKEE